MCLFQRGALGIQSTKGNWPWKKAMHAGGRTQSEPPHLSEPLFPHPYKDSSWTFSSLSSSSFKEQIVKVVVFKRWGLMYSSGDWRWKSREYRQLQKPSRAFWELHALCGCSHLLPLLQFPQPPPCLGSAPNNSYLYIAFGCHDPDSCSSWCFTLNFTINWLVLRVS